VVISQAVDDAADADTAKTVRAENHRSGKPAARRNII